MAFDSIQPPTAFQAEYEGLIPRPNKINDLMAVIGGRDPAGITAG
jgi:hypothetical protein